MDMDIMHRRFVPAEAVKTITVDESLVLVDQRSGQYFGLNEVGAEIWRLVAAGHEPSTIVDTISNDYEADASVIAEDTKRIVTELANVGLIRALAN